MGYIGTKWGQDPYADYYDPYKDPSFGPGQKQAQKVAQPAQPQGPAPQDTFTNTAPAAPSTITFPVSDPHYTQPTDGSLMGMYALVGTDPNTGQNIYRDPNGQLVTNTDPNLKGTWQPYRTVPSFNDPRSLQPTGFTSPSQVEQGQATITPPPPEGQEQTSSRQQAPPPAPPMIGPDGSVPPGMPFDPTGGSSGGFDGHAIVDPVSYIPPEFPKYQAAPITQFQAPNFAPQIEDEDAVLSQILKNPTLSPQWLAGQQEQAKELALARNQATLRTAQNDAIHRGVPTGGAFDASKRRLAETLTNQLLTSNRDLSATAETTNRKGFIDALGATEGVLSGRSNRATQLYNSLLAGQQAQANEKGREYQSGVDALNYGLDANKLAEMARQFNLSTAEGRAQFEKELAFRYAEANAGNYYKWLSLFGG